MAEFDKSKYRNAAIEAINAAARLHDRTRKLQELQREALSYGLTMEELQQLLRQASAGRGDGAAAFNEYIAAIANARDPKPEGDRD